MWVVFNGKPKKPWPGLRFSCFSSRHSKTPQPAEAAFLHRRLSCVFCSTNLVVRCGVSHLQEKSGLCGAAHFLRRKRLVTAPSGGFPRRASRRKPARRLSKPASRRLFVSLLGRKAFNLLIKEGASYGKEIGCVMCLTGMKVLVSENKGRGPRIL